MEMYIAHVRTPEEPTLEATTLPELLRSVKDRKDMLKEERSALFIRVIALWGFLALTTTGYLCAAITTPDGVFETTIVLIVFDLVVVASSMGDIYLEYGEKWKLPHIAKVLQLHHVYKEWRIEYDRQNAPDALIAMR